MRNRAIPEVSEADKAYVRSLVQYEDASVLAFNKPSGLPVQSRGNKAQCLDQLLWAFARSNGKRPRLVHRIDAGTSGLVLAAKTKPAAAALSQAFEARRVEKTYLALVKGDLPEKRGGRITAPLMKVERGSDGMPAHAIVSEDRGQAAKTDWRLLSSADTYALFEVRPVTGRMHQIRVHLAHIGIPIIGDVLYGPDKAAGHPLMLHAYSLTLPYPDGKAITLNAPLPPHFIEFADLNALNIPDAYLHADE
ncbi:MAG: RluA family pseudouridine synthase [Henriciella sp.]